MNSTIEFFINQDSDPNKFMIRQEGKEIILTAKQALSLAEQIQKHVQKGSIAA